MLKFAFGVFIGGIVCASYVAFSPHDAPGQFRAIGQVLVAKASETKYDICRRQFLDETHCFQDKDNTDVQCERLVHKKCD